MFATTLGHSRPLHVPALRHEQQQVIWFSGVRSRFGGVPEELVAASTPLRYSGSRHDPTLSPPSKFFATQFGFHLSAAFLPIN